MSSIMQPLDEQRSASAPRAGFFARYWWLIALLLLVLPAAVVVWIVYSTPDVQTFNYPVR